MVNTSKMMRTFVAFGLAFCLWFGGGCSEETWQTTTVPASGTVTVNGEVPEGAIVRLHPVGDAVDQRGSRPSAIVGKDGTYVLTTYEYGDGAPPGDYFFTLYWPVDPKLGGLSPDRLQNAYVNPRQSGHQVTIAEDAETLAPVAIEGAKIKKSAPARPAGGPPQPGSR